MTEAVQEITLSPSRDIPLNKLVLRQSNIRRFEAGILAEQLAKSIMHRSLLQRLNVWPILEVEGNETGTFEVPAHDLHCRAHGFLTAMAHADAFAVREESIGREKIMSWKLRMFVPTDASGIEMRKVLDTYLLSPIGEREAV